jgi:hypothetical protein
MSVRIHGTFGSWVLPQGESVLGRGPTCSVRIDDPRLSRRHAVFAVHGNGVTVADAGAKNGVLVDGVRINGVRDLRHGAVVVCGPVVLMVSIDETQPHPREAEGGQDPTTRRQGPRSDTEMMLDAIVESDRKPIGSTSRGIDPAIAAAISSSAGRAGDPARSSALQPAEAPGSVTSPLDAVRPDPHVSPPPRRSPSTASSMEALPHNPTASGALEMPREAAASIGDRCAAGLVDGMRATALALPGLLICLAGYAGALAAAGAVVVHGVPRIAPGHPAGLFELLATLLQSDGWAAAPEAASLAASSSVVAAGILVTGLAFGSLFSAVGLLWVIVLPTAEHGAPDGHRRRGLAIVRERDGARPSWSRACVRWGLAGVLWPLAIPAALIGMRAPHDVLSGCRVRRMR